MMNCEQIEVHLADYLGNELDAGTRHTVDDHLRSCESCRGKIEALTRTLEVFQSLEAPSMPVETTERPPRPSQPLAYAAVLMAGLTLGWWAKPVIQQPPTSSPTQQTRPIEESPTQPPRWTDSYRVVSDHRFARNAVKLMRALSTH